MKTFAASSLLALASKSPTECSDAVFDEVFRSLWHYDCVISSQRAQTSLRSPPQASVVLSGCSQIGCSPSDFSNEDKNSSLGEGFAFSFAKHHLHPLFRMLDENNDGKVSLEEMMCLLRKLGKELSRNCLVSLMEPLDRSGDMAVDFDEFTSLYRSICSIESDANTTEEGTTPVADARLDAGELLDTFNVYDKNRDGYICAAELAEVLSNLGVPEGRDLDKCQTLIDRVDSDGNGLVDLGEFKEMLRSGCGISETSAKRSCASDAKMITSELGQHFEETVNRHKFNRLLLSI